MTFLILGSVIIFIIYVYFNHILFLKKLKRDERKERLHAVMENSLALLALSGQENFDPNEIRFERRSSLLNAFKKFRL